MHGGEGYEEIALDFVICDVPTLMQDRIITNEYNLK
jgi:hypothetical protein